ncbi:putative major facilitator superfamily protein (MFS) [Leishmania major strain Friedlin]|uniref:Putative major facilitator superfamily protein (MFS) n=1 Tax=Leishmania major TaxID=5664 RepID=Q4QE38_LEIMA|nr:putative major facilitator superfamily protein (MFS) [Leishmania major strain Friedlin]CAG9572387.1 major_facilitator_superfamily_protein_(MFS)_-_putative [Leishmania major strain Friedlin]CAJ03415.1 putative major facilitator superfamily protein (MFS) [Leishmania major strain Friedlin]|eukprot:XP_001682410.1 putative major facilitator superfamily protein (MFS) [Leishmania major strain Friedlin]
MGTEEVSQETTLLLPNASRDGATRTAAVNAEVETWMTPRMVLWTFTVSNFLLYFDRGATVGALSSICSDRDISDNDTPLSDAKRGFLVSGFIMGYVVASPFFTSRGSAWGSRMVILLGMALWCATCLACAISLSYTVLLVCRILVGVAEAAFVAFTVTIVDNTAPATHRTSWIGFFYSMIPIGTAVGMGCAGLLTSYPALWGFTPWRVIYVTEVVAALPIVVLLCYIPACYHLAPATEFTPQLPFLTATGSVLCNANYMLLVIGLSMYCFVTGAVSTWGIPLLHEGPLQLPKATAALLMGIETTCSAVAGSLVGGLAVDYWGGSTGSVGVIQCQQFNILMILIAIPCGVAALLRTDALVFAITFAVAVTALFAITAPINASILTVVPAGLRPYAVSYSIFIIHLLGDFPSPTLAGIVSDFFGRSCRGLSRDGCHAAEQQFQCAWMDDADGLGRCMCRVELRNALLLVFAYLFLAPPCWTVVWWRLRREVQTADVSADDGEDSSTLGTPGMPAFPLSHSHDEHDEVLHMCMWWKRSGHY